VDPPRLRPVESNGAGPLLFPHSEIEADCCGCLEEGQDWQRRQRQLAVLFLWRSTFAAELIFDELLMRIAKGRRYFTL
jgi:hypothetical protein